MLSSLRTFRGGVAAVALGLFSAPTVAAQVRAPSDGGTTVSIGQPRPWKWTVGLASGALFQRGEEQEAAQLRVGLFRDLLNPVVGFAGAHIEEYVGLRDMRLDGGVRARLVSPMLRFGVGADYNIRDDRTRLVLSAFHPGRRGGLFRDGTAIRVDYVPARNHSVSVGIETPVLRRVPTGRSRPRLDHARLASPTMAPLPTPESGIGLAEPIANIRTAAAHIRLVNVPYLGREASGSDAEKSTNAELALLKRTLARSATTDGEVRRFHAEIARAYSMAIVGRLLPPSESTDAGRQVAAQTRTVMLREVLIPYNQLLGQVKKHDSIREFANRARGIFLRWLHVDSPVPAERIEATLWVFTQLLDIVEENRAAARAQWRDSRYVWLPLQYALLPDEHDTQAELDGLVELATGTTFTEGNFVSYVINEQFQYQLSRTIRQANDYHVLWTHDYRGFDYHQQDGKVVTDHPDEQAYRHVLRSYLRAMTERVRAYDTTGKFPVYMILLDEWFYQARKGALWMSLLEDPTRHRLHLPSRFKAWEDSIVVAQDSLRAAIAGSALLQSQKALFGEEWLRNLIKVHVSITNPSDPSFWSWSLLPMLPLSDNAMRDHRKLVFYDLTEEDPYRGEAMFTGAGVGEHYANLAWEDRSLLVRGPAALGLKAAARNALRTQGIPADRIPYSLQPREKAANYDARVREETERGTRSLRAMQIHNGTGFDAKHINVAKAVLYTLMPPGSVIKIPDSLWNSSFWGSAMFGCALRGVRVLIIAPSLANHPVSAAGSHVLGRELLWRLLTGKQALAPEIAAAGGVLGIGLFATNIGVTNIPAKVRSVQTTLQEYGWLRDLFAFPASTYAELDQLVTTLAAVRVPRDSAPEFEYDPKPKLHLKANFFASREAWTLMQRPEWPSMTLDFLQQRLAQVLGRSNAVRSFEVYQEALLDVGGSNVEDWFAKLSPDPKQRTVFYTMMGSQNQNFRSMVTDGEDAFVVAGWPSIIPYLDLLALIGQCRWLETTAELDPLLPAQGWLWTSIAHWFKLGF